MRERLFRFKQFNVSHAKCAMKVGTDGVLVGAWCDAEGAKSVLDIGTGCGLIALMVAQRNSYASILAIDIEQNAIEEAAENFSNSPWGNRLKAEHADFTSFAANTQQRFDLIVSNPPFFVDSLLSPDKNRATARHTCQLSFDDLISLAAQILAPAGRLCIITPAENENAISSLADCNSLHLRRKTYVHSITGTQPKRILWCFSNEASSPIIDHLTIELSRLVYSDEYIALTRDFYINM